MSGSLLIHFFISSPDYYFFTFLKEENKSKQKIRFSLSSMILGTPQPHLLIVENTFLVDVHLRPWSSFLTSGSCPHVILEHSLLHHLSSSQSWLLWMFHTLQLSPFNTTCFSILLTPLLLSPFICSPAE